MMVFTRKSREDWAKKKAKELGYKEDEILLGDTHASFMKSRKASKFSALQIKYPKTLLEFLWDIFQRGIIICGWVFLGWLLGKLIGWYLFGEGLGENVFMIIGMICGALWGWKSNWLIC